MEKLPWLGRKKDFVRTHWRIERMDYKWSQCWLLRLSGEDIWEVATWRSVQSGIDAKFVWSPGGFSQEYGIFWIYGLCAQNPIGYGCYAFSYVSSMHSIRNKATGSLVTETVDTCLEQFCWIYWINLGISLPNDISKVVSWVPFHSVSSFY